MVLTNSEPQLALLENEKGVEHCPPCLSGLLAMTKNPGFVADRLVQIPAHLHSSCVTLEKLLNLNEPVFSPIKWECLPSRTISEDNTCKLLSTVLDI